MIECEFGTRQIKNGGRTRDRTLDLSRVKGGPDPGFFNDLDFSFAKSTDSPLLLAAFFDRWQIR
jgi:hypothetical protein